MLVAKHDLRNAPPPTIPAGSVQDVESQAFQVLSFGVMQAHRMGDRRPDLLYDPGSPPRIDGGAEDHLLKQIRREMLGAGEGQEKSSGIEMPEGMEIEKFVSAGGGINVAPPVVERGRVEHDHIKAGPAFLQV